MTYMEAESLYRRELETSVDSFQAYNLQSNPQNTENNPSLRISHDYPGSQSRTNCSDATNSVRCADSDDDFLLLGQMNRLISQDLSTMSEANMQNRPLRPQVNGYGIYKYERTGSRDSLMTNYFTSLDSLVGDFRGLMKNPAYSGNTPRTSTPIRMRSEAMMRQYSEPLVMQIGLDEQRRVNHHRPTRQGRSPRVSRDSNRQWRNNRCMSGSGSSTRNNRAEPMYPPGLSNHIAKTLTIDPTNGNSFSVNSIDTEDNVVPPPMESGLPEQYIAKFPLVRYGPRARSTHCNICLEDYTDGEILRKLPCRHIYHRDCVDTWFRRRSICPTCRLDYVVRAVA